MGRSNGITFDASSSNPGLHKGWGKGQGKGGGQPEPEPDPDDGGGDKGR